MRILVTGCAGYIGSVLCPMLLNSGHTVVGIDSCRYGNKSNLLTLSAHDYFQAYSLDVRDVISYRREIIKADIIIPLAALVGAPICDLYPVDALEINHIAIKNIIPLLSKQQKIIYPNTNSSYGINDDVCDENTPMKPISVYGVSKANAETDVLSHTNSIVFRLATVFGFSPRMRFDLIVNDFVSQLHYGNRLKIFEPHYKRNFVHVKDIARAFKFACVNQKMLGVYNLGHTQINITKMELAESVVKHIGLNPAFPWITIGEGKDVDQRNYFISNQKIVDSGFEFKYDLEYGIKEVSKMMNIITDEDIKIMSNMRGHNG